MERLYKKQREESMNKNTTTEGKKEDEMVPESRWPEWLKSSAGFFWETFKIVIISLAIILPIRYFLVQPFYVRGASMEPAFHDFEYLLIDEISYRFDEPKRGDIVVFRYPDDPRQFFIKRVIGLPGEHLELVDGSIAVSEDGIEAPTILDEPYLPENLETVCLDRYDCSLPIDLTVEEYFVMGDNRPASFDSRYFGPLHKDDIIGKAWVRVWPFSTFTTFKAHTYNL